jgi:subfamily B ATP-binding cassette protein MsbA
LSIGSEADLADSFIRKANGQIAKFKVGAANFIDIYLWIYRSYMRHERGRLFLNFLCLAVSAGVMAILAWLVSPAIDKLSQSAYSQAIYLIPIGVMAMVTANGFALYYSQILSERITQNTTTRMQRDVYKRFLSLNLSEIASFPSGLMIGFVTSEVGRAISGLTTLLIGITRDLLSFVFLVIVMVVRDWQLSTFILLSFPPLIVAVAVTSRNVRKATGEAMNAGFSLTRLSTEVLTSLRLVKIFDSSIFEAARHREAAELRRDKAIKLAKRKAVMTPINEIAGGLAIASVLTFAIIRADIRGVFQFSDIASFLTAVFLAYRPLKKITGSVPQFVEGLYAAERIRALDQMATESRESDANDDGGFLEGNVEFDNVTFSYVANKPVLKNVSLKLPKGKTVALVGPSGSGKTSLLNLIPRLYHVDEGVISVDGTDINEHSLAKLRRSIALVSQDTMLLDDTVLMNVAYGAREVDPERALACLKEANAMEFVSKLPSGINTQLGERALTLSGGQRQRLALARALYRDAPILLLDEPTSALDGESEREVRAAIQRIAKDRSILIVAHRLPAIQFADYVYVLVDGVIVEHGTHEKLNKKNGVYATIFHIQELEEKFGRQLTN